MSSEDEFLKLKKCYYIQKLAVCNISGELCGDTQSYSTKFSIDCKNCVIYEDWLKEKEAKKL